MIFQRSNTREMYRRLQLVQQLHTNWKCGERKVLTKEAVYMEKPLVHQEKEDIHMEI